MKFHNTLLWNFNAILCNEISKQKSDNNYITKLWNFNPNFLTVKKEYKKKEDNRTSNLMRCYKCGQLGHGSRECGNDVKCFKCSKTGHKSPDCPTNKKAVSAMVVKGMDPHAVYLDSCASHHMSPHRNLFVEFSESSPVEEVCQGDDSPLKVEG